MRRNLFHLIAKADLGTKAVLLLILFLAFAPFSFAETCNHSQLIPIQHIDTKNWGSDAVENHYGRDWLASPSSGHKETGTQAPQAIWYCKQCNSFFTSERAEEAFRKAVMKNPSDVFAWSGLGRAIVSGSSGNSKKRMQEAEECLRRATIVQPNYAPGWYYLADFLHYRKDDSVAAGDAYQKALKLNPKDEDAITQLRLLRTH